jgi:hypothetical protein
VGTCSGAPEEFRLRSLLFSADRTGWVAVDMLEAVLEAAVSIAACGRLRGGLEDCICVLKVTVLCGRFGGRVLEGRSGDDSVGAISDG